MGNRVCSSFSKAVFLILNAEFFKGEILPLKDKLPAAVELGRRGAKARLQKLSPERRQEIARNAVKARWNKRPVSRGPAVRESK